MSAENPTAGMGRLLYFPNANDSFEYRDRGNSYSVSQSEVIADTAMRLGLHPEFGDIFREHLADLNLVICEYPPFWEGEKQPVRLDVQPVYDTRFDTDVRDQDAVKDWKRLLIVSHDEIDTRRDQIARAGGMTAKRRENRARDLSSVAMDWIFAEQATYVLGNAVYMQRNLGHYMDSLNGQAEGFLLEHTPSIEYIKKLDLPEGTMSVHEDFLRLKTGFGLIRLGESLLKHALFDSYQKVERVVGRIARIQQSSYGADQMRAHLGSLEPRDAVEYYQSFGNSYDWDDSDPDDED